MSWKKVCDTKGMTHEMAVRMAHGGFRVTRFEALGNEIIRVVYEREKRPKKRRQSPSTK